MVRLSEYTILELTEALDRATSRGVTQKPSYYRALLDTSQQKNIGSIGRGSSLINIHAKRLSTRQRTKIVRVKKV